VEQLAGLPLPASALESLILPSRVADYSPGQLDELTLSGEVVWAGAGSIPGNDGWIALAPADIAALVLPPPDDLTDPVAVAVQAGLGADEAVFFRSLLDRIGTEETDAALATAVWELVWAGVLTNDTLAPVRALLSSGTRSAHAGRPRPPRGRRYGRYSGLAAPGGGAARPTPPGMSGRWSMVATRDTDPTRRALAAADVLLDRYGVVTRG
jgi:ATP-dependent Lhr-like helicase